jgi:hypothetical protein
MSQVTGIKCDYCGAFHDVDTTSYVSVQGNIILGQHGGLVGNNIKIEMLNNLEEKIQYVKTSHFCFPDCFAKVLGIETKYTKQMI